MSATERTVGLAVGRGTGAEIAAVFERVLDRFARMYGTGIAVERSRRTYHSYVSLKSPPSPWTGTASRRSGG
ncbi:hypothetical protein NKH77_02030 [Streptomyces sp. M19]